MAKTKKEVKSLSDHLQSAAKYSGTTLSVSAAIVGILIFYRPELKDIETHIYALVAFFGNLLLVVLVKKTENNTK